jgi:hypothetical protein
MILQSLQFNFYYFISSIFDAHFYLKNTTWNMQIMGACLLYNLYSNQAYLFARQTGSLTEKLPYKADVITLTIKMCK